nr:hypothetical protein [Candidatus Levybacteria bacterium]
MPEPIVDTQRVQTETALRTRVTRPIGPPTAQQQRTDSLINTVIEQRAATETGTVRPEVISTREATQLIDDLWFAGQQRDGTGMIKDSRQRVLRLDSINSHNSVTRFATEGFSALNPTDQVKIVDRFSHGLDRLPGGAALPPRGTPERRAYVEAWLSDPRNAEYYSKLVSVESAFIRSGEGNQEEIKVAREQVQAAESTRDAVVAKLGEQQQIIQQIDRDIATFDASADKGLAIPGLTSTLDNAQRNYDSFTGTIELHNTRLQMITQRRAALHADRTLNSADKLVQLAAIEGEEDKIARAYKAAIEAQAAARVQVDRVKSQLEPLQNERQGLDTKRTGAQAEWEDLLSQFKDAGINIDQSYSDLTTAMGGREFLPDRLMSSIETALVDLITERESTDSESIEKELQAMVDGLKEADAETLKNGVRELFYTKTRARGVGGIMKGHDSRKLNKGVVSRVWGLYLNGSTEDVVRAVLEASGNSPAEIAAKLADREFMKQATPQVMEELIRLRVKTGAKISENEVDYTATFDWAEGMFQKALVKNPQVAKDLEALAGQGKLEGTTLAALRRADRATILKILLALFGSAAIVAGTVGIGGVVAVGAGGASLGKSLSMD